MRASSASELAPAKAATDAGAVYVSDLSWWFDCEFQRKANLNSHRYPLPAALFAQGGLSLRAKSIHLNGYSLRLAFRPDPPVGDLSANGSVLAHLMFLDKTLYDGDNRSLQVAVPASVESSAFEHGFDHLRGYLAISFLHDAPNHIGQAKGFFLVKLFPGKFRERRNGLPQIGKTRFYGLQSLLKFSLFTNQGFQLILGTFECRFVCIGCHSN
jgi:hypothetical protein